MSREQWGHVYWQGVRDAQSNNVGTAKCKAEVIAHNAICYMWNQNQAKENDKSIFDVSDLIVHLMLMDYSKRQAEGVVKKVYDYVLENEPWDCYISGKEDSKWREDCFVLPNQIPERSEYGY